MSSSVEVVDSGLLDLFSFVQVKGSVLQVVLEEEEHVTEVHSWPVLPLFEGVIGGQTPFLRAG